MPSLNKVYLMGNLTRDPDLRYTPSGQAVCDLGLAVNRRFQVNGNDREESCFIDVVVWGKTAENVKQYLEKGSLVLVEGRLQFDQWEDQSGAKRSRHRVVAEVVQFLNGRRGGGEGGGYNNPPPQGNSNYRRNQNDGGSGYNAPRGNYAAPPQDGGGNYGGGNYGAPGGYRRDNAAPAGGPGAAPPPMPVPGGAPGGEPPFDPAVNSEEDIPF